MSVTTGLDTLELTGYATIEVLQGVILCVLARWNYITNATSVSWAQNEGSSNHVLITKHFKFVIHEREYEYPSLENVYLVSIYANDRIIRYSSRGEVYNHVVECLRVQFLNPNIEFENEDDCCDHDDYNPDEEREFDDEVYEEEDCTLHLGSCFTGEPTIIAAATNAATNAAANALPAAGVFAESAVYGQILYAEDHADEGDDDDEADEDESDASSVASSVASLDEEDILNMNLRDMSDDQIEKYVDGVGREPRDECNEWTMKYEGGPIIRYSYVNFADSIVSDQQVVSTAISRANFAGATLRNCVFDNVQFYECDFKSVILENVIFKNSTFVECDLEPYMVLDDSCRVEKFDCDEDDHC